MIAKLSETTKKCFLLKAVYDWGDGNTDTETHVALETWSAGSGVPIYHSHTYTAPARRVEVQVSTLGPHTAEATTHRHNEASARRQDLVFEDQLTSCRRV